MRRFHILLLAACIALSPATASAQRLADVAIGRMIRVETANHDVYFGHMQSVTADSVRIGTGSKQPPVALAMQNVVGYSLGMGPDRRRGALTGLGVGSGVGVVVFFLFRSLSNENTKAGQRQFGYNAAALSGLLGATIGAIRAPEKWVAPTPQSTDRAARQ